MRRWLQFLYYVEPGASEARVKEAPCLELSDEGPQGVSGGCPPGAEKHAAVLMPPLCNAHIHAPDYAIAEAGEDESLHRLVSQPNGLKYRLLAGVDSGVLEERLRILGERLLASGTLYAAAYIELGERFTTPAARGLAASGLRLRALPQPSRKRLESYLALLAVEAAGGVGLDTAFDLPRDQLRTLTRRASALGAQVHVHVAEDRALYSRGDIEAALAAGVHVLVHMTMASPEELRDAASMASIVFCPRSNMYHAGVLPRLEELPRLAEDYGGVALGTDNAAWITPSVAEEVSFAYTVFHSRTRGGSRRLAEALLYAATTGCLKVLQLPSTPSLLAVHVPEAAWSSDPVVTLAKRLASSPRSLLSGKPTGLFRKLLGGGRD